MENLIPEKMAGKNLDLSYYLEADSIEEARSVFINAGRRVLNPDKWKKYAGKAGASFQLFNANGEKANSLAREGDYIQVNVPGLGNASGNGYDWVKVVKIERKQIEETDEEGVGMKVKPCSNPFDSEAATAHFFEDGASSTFTVQRQGKKIFSSYYGRNEILNNATGHLKDNIRNTVMGLGAMAGISEIQWSALMKGLLLG